MTVYVLSHNGKWLNFGSYRNARYVSLEKAKFYSTEQLARARQKKGAWIHDTSAVKVMPNKLKVHKIKLKVIKKESLP